MKLERVLGTCVVAALGLALAMEPSEPRSLRPEVTLVGGGAGEEPAVEEATLFVGDEYDFADGPASLPVGSRVAVLEGDPAAAGPFTLRLRFPADYEIPLHTHPAIEHVTVVSGAFHIAMGEGADRSGGRELGPGGFVAIPVGHVHFAWVEEETEVQLHGIGPWGIEYLDPADDPRN